MTNLTIPTITNGELTGEGLQAARNVSLGLSYHASAPKWGADPTGTFDSTPAFKAMFADIRSKYDKGYGGATIYVAPGTYLIEPGVLDIPGRTVILGAPKNTVFVPYTKNIPSGGYSEPTALFSIGSWTVTSGGVNGDQYRMRSGLENIVIKGVWKYDWQAQTGIIKNLTGILFNTYLTSSPQNPDAYHHLENIEIWDVDFGILLIGPDDQGIKANNIHIDRTNSAGLIVGRPLWHPQQISSSGADNHFTNVDIHGCNKGGGDFGGLELYTSNCVFVACKVWYVQRTITDNMSADDSGANVDRFWRIRHGCGIYVRGSRNRFDACEVQEVGGACWVIAGSMNTFSSCNADSASVFSQAGTVTDEKNKVSTLMNTAPGFYITNWAHDLTMNSCQVYSMHGAGHSHKWGYYIESYSDTMSINGCRATHLSSPDLAVSIPSKFAKAGDVYIQVNNSIYTDHVTKTITLAP